MNSKQRGGKDSVNLQADAITVYQGPSLDEVRQIALDVFKANFHDLAGLAKATAEARAEHITNEFLERLKSKYPEGAAAANDPDMQYVLFTAQKEFARSGDEKLGKVLVDLLVDRTRETDRTILQIVLNESIEVASKLTPDQIAALTVIFLVKYTKYLRMTSLPRLTDYINQSLCPFVGDLTKSTACYQHLEYAGCGAVGIGSLSLTTAFRKYSGVFSTGFSKEDVQAASPDLDPSSKLFIPCLRAPDRLQVNAIDEEAVRQAAKDSGLNDQAEQALVTLHSGHLMNELEVKDALIAAAPCSERLLDIWTDSPMQNTTLTSVGIAIAHANYRRVTGEEFSLSIWIN